MFFNAQSFTWGVGSWGSGQVYILYHNYIIIINIHKNNTISITIHRTWLHFIHLILRWFSTIDGYQYDDVGCDVLEKRQERTETVLFKFGDSEFSTPNEDRLSISSIASEFGNAHFRRLLIDCLPASARRYGSAFNPIKISSKAPLYTSSCCSNFFSRTAFVLLLSSLITASCKHKHKHKHHPQSIIQFQQFRKYKFLIRTKSN